MEEPLRISAEKEDEKSQVLCFSLGFHLEQPQNWPPALGPVLAVLMTMLDPHSSHN